MRISDWSSDVCSSDLPVTIAMRPWRSNRVVLIAGSSCKSARQSMAGAWVLQMSSRILLDDDGTFHRLPQLALIGIAEPGADRDLEFAGSADRKHQHCLVVAAEFPASGNSLAGSIGDVNVLEIGRAHV